MPIIGYVPEREDEPILLPRGTYLGNIQTSPSLVLDGVQIEAGNVVFKLSVPENPVREVFTSRTGIRMIINRMGGVRSSEIAETVVVSPDIQTIEN